MIGRAIILGIKLKQRNLSISALHIYHLIIQPRKVVIVKLITCYFGLPGCGKSTFLAKLAKKYQKKGYKTFCLKEYPVDGCYLFDFEDLGVYDIHNSVILIDEISLKADNRDYKKLLDSVKRFMILHRHYNCDIFLFTQQYDGIDRKIRELSTCLFYVRAAGKFSYAVRIDRFIHIDKEQKEIKTGYKISTLLQVLFAFLNGSLQICFRPRYYKYFNSFEAPKLPPKSFPYFKVNTAN